MNNNDEGSEQFSYAMQLVSSTSMTMVLHCVIKLRVLETIAQAGPNARLSSHEIVSRLSIQNQNAPDMLDRMLRLLASYSIVSCSIGHFEYKPVRMYGLSPVAKYFVPNQDGMSLGGFMDLLHDKVFIDGWLNLEDSVVNGGVAFENVHGMNTFEYPAIDERYNKVFNDAMINHTTIIMKEVIKAYHGFDNVKYLVDVGGGLGITLNIIISKYTNISGINFDMPHVICHAPLYPGVKHVGGDMFDSVPKGDAIFMKWIIHDWSDDHCLKLLKNCYAALPKHGKVIILEAILPFEPDTSSYVKSITHLDAIMMTQTPRGKERTEDEFVSLAKMAGFSEIKKICYIFNFWIMEFYK